MNTFVAPLDGSEFSARALPIAAALAREANADLQVVGVALSAAEFAQTYDHVHDATERLPADARPEVDVVIDPHPLLVLLEIVNERGNVLFFASHDRTRHVAELMHFVGSRIIEHTKRPIIVVGAQAEVAPGPRNVVVALDGVHDPESIRSVAVATARDFTPPCGS